MSTELDTTTTGGELAAPNAFTSQGSAVDLAAAAERFASALTLANGICKTAMVPETYRGKPEEAAAAMLAGAELGLPPMTALSEIFIIHGKAGMYAKTMQALCERAGGHFRFPDPSPDSVTVEARRRGAKEWTAFTWTMDRAKQAGYTGGKTAKYQTNPIEMLRAKARAEACRVLFPDVLTGIASLSVEEIELEDLGEAPAQPSATATFTSSAPAEGAPEPITKDDWAQVQAAAAERGMDGPGIAAFVSDTLGRHIAGPGQILKAELPAIIDGLNTEGTN
ncbi:hypothetical protein [Zhihengliuella halotolerans]|uniref:hypothetical protein n=1 Tax=Zhihengliuella halotolerans TaxID=370736 RepID=UPI000C7F9B7E|nr:hypothetical protein [Zhihengliuella halotolerans]